MIRLFFLMLCLPAALRAQVQPALTLNHIYMVLNDTTFNDLSTHKELQRHYGSWDAGMPSFRPPDSSTSVLYLRGRDTYLELMRPQNKFKVIPPATGIGFSREGCLPVDAACKSQRSAYSALAYQTQDARVTLDTASLLWYSACYLPDTVTRMYTWYAAYNPVFLDRLYGGHHTCYTRNAYLEQAWKPEKLLENILLVNIACCPGDYERISKELSSFGSNIMMEKEDRISFEVGEVSIHLSRDRNRKFSALQSIMMSLTQQDFSRYHFKGLRIENEGYLSNWYFGDEAKKYGDVGRD